MSKTSPGRYAVHNFGKNIYSLSAEDGSGVKYNIQRTEPDKWKISGIDKSIAINYTLYANHADGTYIRHRSGFCNLEYASLIALDRKYGTPTCKGDF